VHGCIATTLLRAHQEEVRGRGLRHAASHILKPCRWARWVPGSIADDTAPKPVQAHEENTALVSGYSQGQLKMFLDNGTSRTRRLRRRLRMWRRRREM